MFEFIPYGTPAQDPKIVWLVSGMMAVGAFIDGWKQKVPNWLTFPMVISGWIYSTVAFGLEGLGWSLCGTLVGFLCLFPPYMIGGMGAGDVKLSMGTGAWVWGTLTFYGFCWGAILGGVMGMAMWVIDGWAKHRDQFVGILTEITTIRDPNQLAAIAAQRKSSMLLLPYGVPITIGTIACFAWLGLLR
jgi:prepilin peptidase CpaA